MLSCWLQDSCEKNLPADLLERVFYLGLSPKKIRRRRELVGSHEVTRSRLELHLGGMPTQSRFTYISCIFVVHKLFVYNQKV